LKRERAQIQSSKDSLATERRNRAADRRSLPAHTATAIEEWDDSLPTMLLPLRVETRFKDAELWVRIFPDEIAINTHEKLLTEREQTFGMAYWKALRAAKDDDARKRHGRTL